MCLAPLSTASGVSNIAHINFEAISSGDSLGSSSNFNPYRKKPKIIPYINKY
jgi:hypothetical protein